MTRTMRAGHPCIGLPTEATPTCSDGVWPLFFVTYLFNIPFDTNKHNRLVEVAHGNTEERDIEGWTCLHWAAYKDWEKAALWLTTFKDYFRGKSFRKLLAEVENHRKGLKRKHVAHFDSEFFHACLSLTSSSKDLNGSGNQLPSPAATQSVPPLNTQSIPPGPSCPPSLSPSAGKERKSRSSIIKAKSIDEITPSGENIQDLLKDNKELRSKNRALRRRVAEKEREVERLRQESKRSGSKIEEKGSKERREKKEEKG